MINEIWYDPPGTDSTSQACFIELRGEPGLSLNGYSLSFVDGLDGGEYATPLKLDNQAIGQSGYFVVTQTAGQLAGLPAGTNGISNGRRICRTGRIAWFC
ncbi:MAG: hypothetical protein R3B70_29540 [Polyangiaceae bacterium]